jgi:hypothetical protein
MDKKIKSVITGAPKNTTVDEIFNVEFSKGKRAKSVLDKQRSSQLYKKMKIAHLPLIKYYEDRDWFETATEYDL